MVKKLQLILYEVRDFSSFCFEFGLWDGDEDFLSAISKKVIFLCPKHWNENCRLKFWAFLTTTNLSRFLFRAQFSLYTKLTIGANSLISGRIQATIENWKISSCPRCEIAPKQQGLRKLARPHRQVLFIHRAISR